MAEPSAIRSPRLPCSYGSASRKKLALEGRPRILLENTPDWHHLRAKKWGTHQSKAFQRTAI
jgi:hypothetical protein